MKPGNGRACELNLDGLVGPTHSYAGLSYGNLASERNRQEASNPRQAALQGLAKMKLLADMGIPQAVLPPHERPDIDALRRIGFGGSDADVLMRASRDEPALLAACCSASGMWAANAATVSPSADTADGRVHFTPANLVTQFHRSLEAATTSAVLRAIFADDNYFAHHASLPGTSHFADEGAANHTRLCADYGDRGIEIYVYGRSASGTGSALPQKFPARQTREACAAISRLHGLRAADALFVQQSPRAIDAGAFHNDVVAVGNLNVLFHHEAAFAAGAAPVDAIREAYSRVCGGPLAVISVEEEQVPLSDAVETYLFNSQIVHLPDGSTALIAPLECRGHARVGPLLDSMVAKGDAITRVEYVDVRQSMRNGGGPACLRLRVALTSAELQHVHPSVLLNDALYARLSQWISRHYREHLAPGDLADPKLLDESRAALDELSQILRLGSIYRFQGASGL